MAGSATRADGQGVTTTAPAYVVFAALQAVVAVWLYRMALEWEGDLMQRREQQILEIVASKTT